MKNIITLRLMVILVVIALTVFLPGCESDNHKSGSDIYPDEVETNEVKNFDEIPEPYFEDFDINFVSEQMFALSFLRPEHWAAFQGSPYETVEENLAVGFELSFWDPMSDPEPSISITFMSGGSMSIDAIKELILSDASDLFIEVERFDILFFAEDVEAAVVNGMINSAESFNNGMAVYLAYLCYDDILYMINIKVNPDDNAQLYITSVVTQSFVIDTE